MEHENTTNALVCLVPGCAAEVNDYLGDHLLEMHGLVVTDYLAAFPGAPLVSPRLRALHAKNHPARRHPPAPDALHITLAGITFPVEPEVPASACLPMPEHYRTPKKGKLGLAVQHVAVALKNGRSIYVHGLPGSGKDALFHAFSALTRRPGILKSIKPGTDIVSWFFIRGFTREATCWEEGEVLQVLRDGYVTPSGRRVPYLVLISDFDRADREQAEHVRLITDSILGRVDGPAGKIYTVLPGTIIVATGNTAGGGDERGRMSSTPLDASLMDRFQRKFMFPWMDWKDEEPIVLAKFPLLAARFPSAFKSMKDITVKVREAILGGELHAEFSHRAVCQVLGHTEDILAETEGAPPKTLLRTGVRAWLDGLPDEENRQRAVKLMDPYLGTLEPDNSARSRGRDLMSVFVQ